MAKFQLGDIVTYSNKNYGLMEPVEGTIIAFHDGDAVIKLEDKTLARNHWNITSKSVLTTDPKIAEEFFAPLDGISVWVRMKSSSGLYAPLSSKNLKSAMAMYDPKQAGDRDDDI